MVCSVQQNTLLTFYLYLSLNNKHSCVFTEVGISNKVDFYIICGNIEDKSSSPCQDILRLTKEKDEECYKTRCKDMKYVGNISKLNVLISRVSIIFRQGIPSTC